MPTFKSKWNQSREILTINTHRGLFKYTRLPSAIKTAPVIFQHIIDMISSLLGTAASLDIIVVGEPEEELQGRIGKLLERIEKYGFHLRG
ncbi:unnamed protein product [Hymenolepis diminuta]|uniref:SUA5 domain-containing protein n=1 Tax=Hymenolepis diminuta TaxID=6216 RepID=A0A0R3SIZ9_HYMDI|nr:unnamed protein product [Hymenolepis diminuta]